MSILKLNSAVMNIKYKMSIRRDKRRCLGTSSDLSNFRCITLHLRQGSSVTLSQAKCANTRSLYAPIKTTAMFTPSSLANWIHPTVPTSLEKTQKEKDFPVTSSVVPWEISLHALQQNLNWWEKLTSLLASAQCPEELPQCPGFGILLALLQLGVHSWQPHHRSLLHHYMYPLALEKSVCLFRQAHPITLGPSRCC